MLFKDISACLFLGSVTVHIKSGKKPKCVNKLRILSIPVGISINFTMNQEFKIICFNKIAGRSNYRPTILGFSSRILMDIKRSGLIMQSYITLLFPKHICCLNGNFIFISLTFSCLLSDKLSTLKPLLYIIWAYQIYTMLNYLSLPLIINDSIHLHESVTTVNGSLVDWGFFH